MPRKEILDRIEKYVDPFRITKGKGFKLADFDPGDTRGLRLDKGETADAAIVRVETVRSLEALARHAWRSAAHLVSAEN